MPEDETAICAQWITSDGKRNIQELIVDRLLPWIGVGHQLELDELLDDGGTRINLVVDEVAWRVRPDNSVLLWIGAHEMRD